MSIVWYKVYPALFGGQKGIVGFNNALANHFQLVCVCSSNNIAGDVNNDDIINRLPVSKSQFINPFVWYKLLRFAKQHNVTHVILEHPYHAIAGWLLKLNGIRVITHSHNIEYIRFKEMGKPFWPILKLIEQWVYRYSEKVIFKTTEDKLFAIHNLKVKEDRCFVITFGVERKNVNNKDLKKRTICLRYNLPPTTTILLFNGTLDYEPNARAVYDIYHHLAPALDEIAGFDYNIIITGRNDLDEYQDLAHLNHPRVINAGFVADVEAIFLAVDVYINPVQKGGGIQTKTLEALSYHLNVVCFNHMTNGIEMSKTNNKVLIAKKGNWKEFASNTYAASRNDSTTPDAFFQHYSFANQIDGVKEKIFVLQ